MKTDILVEIDDLLDQYQHDLDKRYAKAVDRLFAGEEFIDDDNQFHFLISVGRTPEISSYAEWWNRNGQFTPAVHCDCEYDYFEEYSFEGLRLTHYREVRERVCSNWQGRDVEFFTAYDEDIVRHDDSQWNAEVYALMKTENLPRPVYYAGRIPEQPNVDHTVPDRANAADTRDDCDPSTCSAGG